MDRADENFAEFMRVSGNRLYRLAYLLTGDRHRAEDLTQDALARTYAAWRRVAHDNAYAYTRRILVNLHNDWWRGRHWREHSVGEPPETRLAPDPAHGVADRDWAVRALRRLTRKQRAIVVLRYFADLSEVEVARELEISVGTVKSTTAHALARLRQNMADPANPMYTKEPAEERT